MLLDTERGGMCNVRKYSSHFIAPENFLPPRPSVMKVMKDFRSFTSQHTFYTRSLSVQIDISNVN